MVIRWLVGVVLFHIAIAKNVRTISEIHKYNEETDFQVALEIIETIMDGLNRQTIYVPFSQADMLSVSDKINQLAMHYVGNTQLGRISNKWNNVVGNNVLVLDINNDKAQLELETNDQNAIGKEKVLLTFEMPRYDVRECDYKLSKFMDSAYTAFEVLSTKNICNKNLDEKNPLLDRYTRDLIVTLWQFLEYHKVPREVALEIVLYRPVEDILQYILEIYKTGHGIDELKDFEFQSNEYDLLHELINHLVPIEYNLKIVAELESMHSGLIGQINSQPNIPYTQYRQHYLIYMNFARFLNLHQVPNEEIMNYIQSKNIEDILIFITALYDNVDLAWKVIDNFELSIADRDIINELRDILSDVDVYQKYKNLLDVLVNKLQFVTTTTPKPTIKPNINKDPAHGVIFNLLKFLKYHDVSDETTLNVILNYELKQVLIHIIQAFEHEVDDLFNILTVLPDDSKIIVDILVHLPTTENYLFIFKKLSDIINVDYSVVIQANTFDNTKVTEFDSKIEIYKLFTRFLLLHQVESDTIISLLKKFSPKHVLEIVIHTIQEKDYPIENLPAFTLLPDDVEILVELSLLLQNLPVLSNEYGIIVVKLIEEIKPPVTPTDPPVIPTDTPTPTKAPEIVPVHIYTRNLIIILLEFLETHNVPHEITVDLLLNYSVEDILKLILDIYQKGSGNDVIPGFSPQQNDFQYLVQILGYFTTNERHLKILEEFSNFFPGLLQELNKLGMKIKIEEYENHHKFMELYRIFIRFLHLHAVSTKKIISIIKNQQLFEILDIIIQLFTNPNSATEIIPNFHITAEDLVTIDLILTHIRDTPLYEKYIVTLKNIIDNIPVNPDNRPLNELEKVYSRDLITVLLKFLANHHVPEEVAITLVMNKSVSEILSLLLYLYRNGPDNNILIGFLPGQNDFEPIALILKHLPPVEAHIKIIEEFNVIFPGIINYVNINHNNDFANSIHLTEIYRLFIQFLYNHGVTYPEIMVFIQNNDLPQILDFMIFVLNNPHKAPSIIQNFQILPEDHNIVTQILFNLPKTQFYNIYINKMTEILDIIYMPVKPSTEIPAIIHIPSGKIVEKKYTNDLITLLISFLVNHNVSPEKSLYIVLNMSIVEILTLLQKVYQYGPNNEVFPEFTPMPNDYETIIVVIKHLPPTSEILNKVKELDILFPGLINEVDTITGINSDEYKIYIKFYEIKRHIIKFFVNHGVSETKIWEIFDKSDIPELIDIILLAMEKPSAAGELIPGFQIIPEDRDVIIGILSNLPKDKIYNHYIVQLNEVIQHMEFTKRPALVNNRDLLIHLVTFLQEHSISSDKVLSLLLEHDAKDIFMLIVEAYRGAKDKLLLTFLPKSNDFEILINLLSRLPNTDSYQYILKYFDELFPGIYNEVMDNPTFETYKAQKFQLFLSYYRLFVNFSRVHGVSDETILKLILEYEPIEIYHFIISAVSNSPSVVSIIPGFIVMPEPDIYILQELMIVTPEVLDIPSTEVTVTIKKLINDIKDLIIQTPSTELPTIQPTPDQRPEYVLKIQDIMAAFVHYLEMHNVPQEVAHKLVLSNSFSDILQLLLKFYENGSENDIYNILIGYTPLAEDFQHLVSLLLHIPLTEDILLIIQRFDSLFPGLYEELMPKFNNIEISVEIQTLIEITKLAAKSLYIHGVSYEEIVRFLDNAHSLQDILNETINFIQNEVAVGKLEYFTLIQDLDILSGIIKIVNNKPEYEIHMKLITELITMINKLIPVTKEMKDFKFAIIQFIKLHNVPEEVILNLVKKYSLEDILHLIIEVYKTHSHNNILVNFVSRVDDFELLVNLLSIIPQTDKMLIVINEINQIFPGILVEIQKRIMENKSEFEIEIRNKISQILSDHEVPIDKIVTLLNKYDNNIINLLIDIYESREKFKDIMPDFVPLLSDIAIITDIIKIIQPVPGSEHNIQKLNVLFEKLQKLFVNTDDKNPESEVKQILEIFLLKHNVPKSKIEEILKIYDIDTIIDLIISVIISSNSGTSFDSDIIPNFRPLPEDINIFFDIVRRLAQVSYEKFGAIIAKIKQVYPEIVIIEQHQQVPNDKEVQTIVTLIISFLIDENVPLNDIQVMLNDKPLEEVLQSVSMIVRNLTRNPIVRDVRNSQKLNIFKNKLRAALKNYPNYYNIVFNQQEGIDFHFSGMSSMEYSPSYEIKYGNYENGMTSATNLNKLDTFNNVVIFPRSVNYIDSQTTTYLANKNGRHFG